MRTSAFASLVAVTLTTVHSQVTVNPDGTFSCAKPNASYCAGDSLNTNIIIRCTRDSRGFGGNCNDNLAGVPPLGVKTFAPCYETSKTAGDAACSFNGLVYGPNGTFPVPSTSPSGVASSGGAPSPTNPTVPPYPIISGSSSVRPSGSTGTGTGAGAVSTYTGPPISSSAAATAAKVDLSKLLLAAAAIGAFWQS